MSLDYGDGLPETQVDDLSIDSEGGGEIVKDCWLIFGGELIFGVAE